MPLQWDQIKYGNHMRYATFLKNKLFATVEYHEETGLWRARIKERPGAAVPIAGASRKTAEKAKQWIIEWATKRNINESPRLQASR